MSHRAPGTPHSDLMALGVLAVATLVSAGVAASGELPPLIRAAAGVLLLVPLTGYSLTRVLFARVELGVAERLALVVGLAFSTLILSGFMLHLSPFGLNAGSWTALLAAETLVALLLAALRPARTPPGSLASPEAPRARRATFHPSQLAVLVAAAVLTVSAVLVARVGAAEQPHPGFTQLWLLPGDPGTVTVGVRNEEGTPASYRLELLVDGRLHGGPISIDLPDGRQVDRVERMPPTPEPVVVEARLFRLPTGGGDPYRQVRLTVVEPADVTPSAP